MTVAAAAFDERVRLLRSRPEVREAAVIAERFGIDPVTVMDERDVWRRAARYAAAWVLADEERKAAKEG